MITMLIIGIGLGLILEGAGFGSPRKLTGVFVLKDFGVPVVMGGAIVAALAGMLVLGLFGVDTARFFVPDTRYVGQAVGGLIFGVGFFLGGYCPGTAVVAAGSGRLDALPFFGGLVGGYYLWAPLRDAIKGVDPDFFRKLPRDSNTLPAVLGIDSTLLALVFVAAGGAAMTWLYFRFRRTSVA